MDGMVTAFNQLQHLYLQNHSSVDEFYKTFKKYVNVIDGFGTCSANSFAVM